MKKRWFCLLILLLMQTALAQLASFDEEKISIIPPPPPVIDDNKTIVQLELKDYNTKEIIKDIHANIEINGKTSTMQYIGETGILKLYFDPETYDLKFRIDRIDTPGKDFFIQTRIDASNDLEKTVLLLPVGSLRGIVVDKDENAVMNAKIKVDCAGDYGEEDQITADSFGSFTYYWLPVGSCKIFAESEQYMGSKVVDIQHGKLADIEIKLDKKMRTSSYFLLVIFLLLIIIIIYLYKKEAFYKKEDKQLKKEIVKQVNKRANDIMKTLGDKERSVVDFLLENKNSSNQASIKHKTGIPKTSLSRLFESLEKKNIIIIERVGKLKKIRLTDWFLGKD